ncbi:MAG: hypothetical protein JRJ58_13055 [Deltaproteobacteria bacterium]|nr:hypothetical protein [Deltaproteobacteria bacterium]
MSAPLQNLSILRLCCFAIATSIATLLFVASSAQATGNDLGEFGSQLPRGQLGLSVVDVRLPLDFRARIAGLYTRNHYAIDALAFDPKLRPGPAIRRHSLLESRVSIVRTLWDGVEFQVVWAMQSPLSISASPSVDRQTFGAFIRFVH